MPHYWLDSGIITFWLDNAWLEANIGFLFLELHGRMYCYIYDSFLNEKKYDKILAKIENRLANLEINGRIVKISKLKSIEENVLNEIRQGAETIVVVGDDATIFRILNIVADCGITLGIIPVGEILNVSNLLGIPAGECACDILSSRKIEILDLGKVNNNYFISNLDFGNSNEIEITCDKKYTVTPIKNTRIKICNLDTLELCGYKKNFDPCDGLLELVCYQKSLMITNLFKIPDEMSVFPIEHATVSGINSEASVRIDNEVIINTPLEISVIPSKLRVIAGKERVIDR